MSKIFGELFMLIESDKRGVELQLLYADEQFSIPSNVYIIGMMNTQTAVLPCWIMRCAAALHSLKWRRHSTHLDSGHTGEGQ